MIKRLLWIQTIIISISFVAISIGTITYTSHLVEQQNEQLLRARNEVFLKEISMMLQAKATVIEQLGHNPTIRSYLQANYAKDEAMTVSEYKAVRAALSAVKQSDDAFDLIWIANEPQNYYIGNDDELSPPEWDIAKRPWFFRAAKVKDEVVYSVPYVDVRTKQLAVSILYPIFVEGKRIGFAACDFVLSELPKVLAPYIGHSQNQTTMLLSDEGTIIYHSNDRTKIGNYITADAQFGMKLLAMKMNRTFDEDDDHYYVMTKVKQHGWQVATIVENKEVKQKITLFSWRTIASFVFVYVVLLSLTSYVLKRRLRAIPQVVDRLQQLANGVYDHSEELAQRDDEIGQIVQAVEQLGDNLQSSMFEVHQLAYYDALTQLPNRRLFFQQLDYMVDEAAANGQMVTLLYIDLDNFKQVNDWYGHDYGDELLREVGKRLPRIVGANDIVARIGGDEFVMLLAASSIERSRVVAERAKDVLQQPLLIERQTFNVQLSMGVASYPTDATSAEELMKFADLAMYTAKNSGKHAIQWFDQRLSDAANHRAVMEQELHLAFERQEFFVHYQPQLDRDGRCVRGFEALVRWRNERLGFVSPLEFVPLCEEIGLIDALTNFVLRDAIQFEQQLRAATGKRYTIGINISTIQLTNDDLVQQVQRLIAEGELDARCFEFEVTESALIRSYDETVHVLQRLQHLGIHLSLDDFGTGYSSLSYLKNLPIQTLKVDRSFIKDMMREAKDRVMLEMIIELVHRLGFEVVAEGVEEEAQLNLLQQWQCHWIQGYYFSKPLAKEEALAFALQRE